MKSNFKYYNNNNKWNYIFTYKGSYVELNERYVNEKLFGIALWKSLIKY